MRLVFCDKQNNIYDHPKYLPAFRSGRHFCEVKKGDLIKLPHGSCLFSLPERHPIYYEKKTKKFLEIKKFSGNEIWAASVFLPAAYLRTYLPAFAGNKNSTSLPLWAYCGVVFGDGEFYAPAFRIDDNPRSDPKIHENEEVLKKKINTLKKKFPKNRLIDQLAYCATTYTCLCARNLFLSRFEAPIPTTPACNSGCLGCLSFQKGSGFEAAQNRLTFKPTPEEISEVILYHFENVKDEAIASFGQGCEGEPLLRAKDLEQAIAMVREKTALGTINLNTNGSLPHQIKLLIKAGLDSIRISLNSLDPNYYNRYFKPNNYSFTDVLKTIDIAVQNKIFVSINLFFLPGITDSEKEAAQLFKFLDKFPINMIQTRNFNIDPDFYLEQIEFKESPAIGIKNLIKILRKDYQELRLGYFNPSL